MRRVLVLALVACSHAPAPPAPDAAAKSQHSQQFTALACTSGAPGDPACPINHVALDPAIAGIGVEVDFIAMPVDTGIYFSNIAVRGGTSGVYASHFGFAAPPCATVLSTAPMIDVLPGATVTLQPQTLVGAPTQTICLVYDDIGPYR